MAGSVDEITNGRHAIVTTTRREEKEVGKCTKNVATKKDGAVCLSGGGAVWFDRKQRLLQPLDGGLCPTS